MVRIFVTIILLAGFASSSWALTLQEAKTNGLVGETGSGYLAIVKNAPPPVQALVNEINQKRKAKYMQMAKKHGIDLRAVERRAGVKAIERTAPGHYFRTNGSGWQRK